MTEDYFQRDITFISAIVIKSAANSRDLLEAAAVLRGRGKYPVTVSLSVLALEELGKAILLDGLLFARSGDDRAQRAQSALRSHAPKLAAIGVVPWFLMYLTLTLTPETYDSAKLVAFQERFATLWEKLTSALGHEPGPQDLDRLKQRGLYVSASVTNEPVSPRDVIDGELASNVLAFAAHGIRQTCTLLLEHQSQYSAWPTRQRESLTPDAQKVISDYSKRIVLGEMDFDSVLGALVDHSA